MTNYKNIFGKPVKFLTTDPDNAEAEGQIWYNSTAGAFKSVVVGEAWASSSPLVNAKQNQSGDGTQTAALSVGGNFPANMSDFELYNGTGWSSQPNVPYDAQISATCGTQTAAITFGGTNPPTPREATTIEYDGSTWTAGGSLNSARLGMFGAGTQTATLAAQGGTAPSAATNITEEYNGSSWTTVNNTVTTKRNAPAGFGVQTAAVGAIGGGDPSENPTNTSEEYDGTNWTASATINTSRLNLSGTGTNTAGLIHGGATGVGGGPNTGATEKWDGTSWSTSSSMATARNQKGSRAGSSSAALAFGGYNGTSPTSLTEEFTRSVNVITGAAWASGGDMNVSRRAISGGAGTATAGMSVGGYSTTFLNSTEEYDGSAWTTSGNYPASLYYLGHGGTQTAGFAAGGGDPVVTTGNNYDGSTWTASGSLNTGTKIQGRAGTQTAGVLYGGNIGPNDATDITEEYNGSSWTTGGTMNVVHGSGCASGGSLTSALAAGGSGGVDDSAAEEYNGTSWTVTGNLLVAVQANGGLNQADNTTGMSIGGYLGPPGTTNAVNIYNGSSWSTGAYFPTSIQQQGGFGDLTAGVVNGGNDGSHRNETVEYNPETSALNIKTLTTS